MTSVQKRWRNQDSMWLCLAIALHGLLLLIPARPGAPTTASIVPLNIRLLAPPAIEKPFVRETVQLTDKDIATENVTETPALLEKLELASQETIREGVIPGTARLLDSAIEMEWPLPAVDDSRRLGVFVPQSLPENRRSGISIEDNLFNGMVLPDRTEVVDRWLSLDGTQNVVINTPRGHTLCGRAQAWGPMQPLVEHVMLFRLCGGGGKRTFEMKKRPAYDRVFAPMANSTIN